MISFIYGSYGCGKTTEILNRIRENTKNGIHTFLIIPDQEAVQFERLSLKVLPAASQLNLEILSFSRLYNRVCREYGGLDYTYITKPIRSLLMWKTLHELSPLLESMSNIPATDMHASEKMIATVNELKASGLIPADLEIASKKLPHDSPLAKRLRDIAAIYTAFDNFVVEKYSDSADDLSKLFDILCKHDFFSGTNVYFDSFSSYTGIQHRIINQIFKTADNVTVTIPLPSPKYSDISTEGIERSHTRLLDSAQRNGEFVTTTLCGNKRTQSDAIAYLGENLWTLSDSNDDAPSDDGSVICEVCDTRYTEAEAVAAHITELLRSGARCRDIVIIARDAELYRGILDTALKKSNIPFFFSEKCDLCSMSAIKFILSALRIKKYNWQRKDVIAHIKTGLCDISREDSYIFEEYVNTWNIYGSRFTDGEWKMNPDGFSARISSRGKNILEVANRARTTLVEPLTKLFILLDASESISDMCRALYSYICECSLEEKLSALALRLAESGEIKAARDTSRVYEIIIDTLASIADAIGDETADTEEFILILKNVFDKTEIGSIPTSIDEVTIGSASMLRTSDEKYAFVIGLCEGEFPANAKDDGFFSSGDRSVLCEMGIELSDNLDDRNSDELMYARRAFCVPSKKLYLFTHSTEITGKACTPSLAFKRVQRLLPSVKIHHYSSNDIEYLVPAAKNAVSVYRNLSDEQLKLSMKNALSDAVLGFSTASQTDVETDECTVSDETLKPLIGKSMHFSPTSFESYVKCPFGYFCSNILKLRESVNDTFANNNIGSFVHNILEHLIKNTIPKNENEAIPTDDELLEMTNRTVQEYIETICPESLLNSKKLEHLYTRLKNLSLLLIKNIIEEFSHSKFYPAFFELRADGHGDHPEPLVFKLNDGTEVTFGGTVDRVDLYKHGDDVYIRVIDYKTGDKKFSLSDVDKGLSLQMLIYLFTLCRSKSVSFKASIGLTDSRDALPAGIMYLSSKIPTIEADGYSAYENVISEAQNNFSRTGLILNDENIMSAMNNELDTKFITGTRDKSGKLVGDSFISSEEFTQLYDKINQTVIKFAHELKGGRADAHPLKSGGKLPCMYCEAKAICRKRILN